MADLGKIIVTGASGFIGQQVCQSLEKKGFTVRRFSRKTTSFAVNENWVQFDAETSEDFSVFHGSQVVIHLAGRAHIMRENLPNPHAAFQKDNVESTCKLAKLAIKGGIKRLVFVSSIGVNGNATHSEPFLESSPPAPYDLYAVSKYEAEQALIKLSKKSGLELVIVRPPLVYGPRNPGNFLKLLSLVRAGYAFPLGAVKNMKSMIFVKNLASALVECAINPDAANQIFLVSDGYDVSTANLVKGIAINMNRPLNLMPVPPWLLYTLAKTIGKEEMLNKLISSLVVDSSKIRTQLKWAPPVTFHDGLKETVEWFNSLSTTK